MSFAQKMLKNGGILKDDDVKKYDTVEGNETYDYEDVYVKSISKWNCNIIIKEGKERLLNFKIEPENGRIIISRKTAKYGRYCSNMCHCEYD